MPTDVNALTLAAVLTAAGAVGAATLITGIVSQLKRLPGIGAILDRGNEPAAVLGLSALLVVAAYVSTLGTLSPEGVFGAVVAWYGIAELAMAIHDRASRPPAPAFPADEPSDGTMGAH